MTICSFAAAALARNASEGHAFTDPTMVLLSGGSLASAYASVLGNVAVVVDVEASPESGVRPTVPAKKIAA